MLEIVPVACCSIYTKIL